MPVVTKPFQSQYGFKSPGFEVDSQGNIVATSIIAAGAGGGGTGGTGASDYSFTDQSGYYVVNNGTTQNESLNLKRNTRYTFNLDLDLYSFNIYSDLAGTLYNNGLTHTATDGTVTEEELAQGYSSGSILFTVSSTAPDTLYYGDFSSGVLGTILVTDANGLFGELTISSTTSSTSPTTGALTVAGGAGIGENLFVEGYVSTNGIDVNGVGISSLSSTTNLEIDAANRIVIKNDGNYLGQIDSTGLSISINNSTIETSTINDTVIGQTTPSTAAFTTASVAGGPLTKEGITNKRYVDRTATALAIAFGL